MVALEGEKGSPNTFLHSQLPEFFGGAHYWLRRYHRALNVCCECCIMEGVRMLSFKLSNFFVLWSQQILDTHIFFLYSEHCVMTWTERGIYIFIPQNVQVLLWSEVKGKLHYLSWTWISSMCSWNCTYVRIKFTLPLREVRLIPVSQWIGSWCTQCTVGGNVLRQAKWVTLTRLFYMYFIS